MRAILTLLVIVVLCSATIASTVFVEAEEAVDCSGFAPESFPGIVSGDRILRVWRDDERAGGYRAAIPFAIDTAGRHHLWLAASLPPSTSNWWWRVDGGEWRHFTPDTLGGTGVQYGVSNVMGWVELGAAELAAGEHRLGIRVDERRGNNERAYLLYLDALLVTDRDLWPHGLVTPAGVGKLGPKPPPPVPVQRAGRPGPAMMLGTSVMPGANNRLVRDLGFSLSQSDSNHLDVNETSPGAWDWAEADAGLAECRAAGLRWQYFPHFHWPPAWYRQTDRFVPCTGLRTGRKLACMSLWSPDIVPWFEHGYAALAQHYGSGADPVAAIYVGIHGDFGEATFPMGWHPAEKQLFGEEGIGCADFWCGAGPARGDFRRVMQGRYGTLAALNKAWGTSYAEWQAVDYPPGAYRQQPVTASAQSRRRWLDFVGWYYDSMTGFTGRVFAIARRHFPQSLLVLPVGCGDENLVYAQDNTALPKLARQYGVHIRSTHGGHLPFAQNQSTMLKRIATACKHYGVPFWSEPPGSITGDGEVSRFAEALSCGSWGYWDWGSNPVGAADTFRQYKAFLTRERPVVDTAVFFPTTHHRLHPETGYPQLLQYMGAALRDLVDFDIVDERLVTDGALKGYHTLVWLEGDWIERPVLERLAAWVRGGGTLVKIGGGLPQTVEGDEALSRRLFEGSGKPTRYGNGWVAVYTGEVSEPAGQAAGCRFIGDIVCHPSRFDRTRRDPLQVDGRADGAYTTLLANGEAIVHNPGDRAATAVVAGKRVELPGHSLRSVLVNGKGH